MRRKTLFRILAALVAVVVVGLVPAGAAKTPAEASAAPATPEAADGGTPRIEFETLQHDFGEQFAGDDLTTTFRFKNAGDGVLVIDKVKGG